MAGEQNLGSEFASPAISTAADMLQSMFDILEADIVVMQECKIQRKDLQDDMVLVPGWDVYFSLPKHKKGYSGVAIYTRNNTCAPIRAEEGITGILTPPGSSTSFYDLPEEQQIGGYPGVTQFDGPLDAATLDSEGRCVILEFSAFVLIGTYCPATRDETRDDFRIGFLNALDARIRNLVAKGKRVFLTGDLNIIREELDTANAAEQLRKHGMTGEEYVSTPARRMLNQLLVGGKVFGARDEGREQPVLFDICRSFHPERTGMFTCWEQKTNARPGNFGSRIDYVLCSQEWKDWFCESNIQEGLMGSDHCPVYAVIKDKVDVDGTEMNIKDIMNPPGMFVGGKQTRQWSQKDLLPLSGKLIPEFDRRRNIRDMFAKKPSLSTAESSLSVVQGDDKAETVMISDAAENGSPTTVASDTASSGVATPILDAPGDVSKTSDAGSVARPVPQSPLKRQPESTVSSQPFKRSKSAATKTNSTNKGQPLKGQSSLKGFFKPKTTAAATTASSNESTENPQSPNLITKSANTSSSSTSRTPPQPQHSFGQSPTKASEDAKEASEPQVASSSKPFNPDDQANVIDPIVAKETWSKLLSKRVVPRCEHDEPCVSFLTKKPGINCGRSFYMCPRPLGPSGAKEKNSQWRCGTFIWSSDWTSDST